MKQLVLIIGAVLILCSNTLAQNQAEIDKALLAAPASLRADATVIQWKLDQTYETLKKGTSTLVCYDQSGFPQEQPFAVECTSLDNLDRVAQNMQARALGDRAKSQATLDAAERDGSRVEPEYGSIFYQLQGPDPEHLRTHVTIAVPGATTASTGLPENNSRGGAWIMNAGTSTAHIMIPGGP